MAPMNHYGEKAEDNFAATVDIEVLEIKTNSGFEPGAISLQRRALTTGLDGWPTKCKY